MRAVLYRMNPVEQSTSVRSRPGEPGIPADLVSGVTLSDHPRRRRRISEFRTCGLMTSRHGSRLVDGCRGTGLQASRPSLRGAVRRSARHLSSGWSSVTRTECLTASIQRLPRRGAWQWAIGSYHGTLTVVSNSEPGTRFQITLPAADRDEATSLGTGRMPGLHAPPHRAMSVRGQRCVIFNWRVATGIHFRPA